MAKLDTDLMDLEREYGHFYAPAFAIEVEGNDIGRLGAEVAGVTVDHVLDGADQFSFSVNNPYDPARGEFKWLDSGPFEVGKEIRIKIGYSGRLEAMLLGLITSLRVSFPAGGAPQLEVSGYDLSHRMMKGKRSGSWNDKKDSEVAALVAARYGLSTSGIEDSRITHPKVQQDRESDYDLLKKLADRNGFEFYLREKTLYFRQPARDTAAVVTLRWGATLLGFAPEINIADQVTDVKVFGWDEKSGKEIVGKASRGDEEGKSSGGSTGSEIAGRVYQEQVVEEVRRPVYSQAQADQLAKAVLSKLSEGLLGGSGESVGLPSLKPGMNINIQGLGKKFSRTYYLEKTTHTIGTSGYKTTFSVKDNAL